VPIVITILINLCLLSDAPAAFGIDMQLQGFSYIKANNYSKALDCFNAALKEHPTSWLIMQSVGCCHMELGHYNNAIDQRQYVLPLGDN